MAYMNTNGTELTDADTSILNKLDVVIKLDRASKLEMLAAYEINRLILRARQDRNEIERKNEEIRDLQRNLDDVAQMFSHHALQLQTLDAFINEIKEPNARDAETRSGKAIKFLKGYRIELANLIAQLKNFDIKGYQRPF